MLGITGRLADGTITWMCGPKTLERAHRAAPAAMRRATPDAPAPRVVAGLPIVLTRDADAARKIISEQLVDLRTAAVVPLDARPRRAPRARPTSSLVGDESVLGRELDRLRDVGVTDFVAAVVTTDREAQKRTLEFLAVAAAAMAAALD